MTVLSSIIGLFNTRLALALDPPVVPKNEAPLRFGILGAANIAPSALITPARSHPDVVIYAVAARDETRARAYARKHRIPVVFSSYQDLLDSPDVDAVYNPLPNGLHFEWTMKALTAGKHVLLEKPSSNRAEETRQMFELATKKNLVLLEAFHYRFHPANHRFKEIITSGTLGELRSLQVDTRMFSGFFPARDIRFNYELGGGAAADMGCYGLSVVRWVTDSEPIVEFAKAELFNGRADVDRAMVSDLIFDSSPHSSSRIYAHIACDLARPWKFGILPTLPTFNITATCARGTVRCTFFIMPAFIHSITIHENGKPPIKETRYKFLGENTIGKDWWTTYRYQLEAFVDRVRNRNPQHWISGDDSVAQMRALEAVYVKAGLQLRPASNVEFH
ncbi:D-xylose 1-dehydrogenase (NADP(+)) 2 Short=XDH 2; Flags: Precursor [Serendipita indica DSM 11827]|nr:D-xylose 1-dehydrogenase (NADP(+)) 2 Short=XDH 2; Flags: Precursor [Serendipita indica DSM 11827]